MFRNEIKQIKWDEKTNKLSLITKNKDGSILSEPISSEEAAKLVAEEGRC